MSSTSHALAFADLARHAERAKDSLVRVTLSDGAIVEAHLVSVGPAGLELVDGVTGENVAIRAADVSAIEVHTPRRGREWLLASSAIVGATVALTLYAALPWVRPERDIANGFMLLYAAAGALLPLVLARTRLGAWLNQWRRLYPPSGA